MAKAKKTVVIPTVEEIIRDMEEGFGVKMTAKDKRELAQQLKEMFA